MSPFFLIVGIATVIDGDTLVIDDTRIRLQGIDAPELHQNCTGADGHEWPCGFTSRKRLRQIIHGREVSCDPVDTDKYGRTVAVCHAGDTDLNARMVETGWAMAYRTYSQSYIPFEEKARKERAGMWDSSFIPPWEWRHRDD